MKNFNQFILTSLIVSIVTASAVPPKPPQVSRYRALHTNSPMTDPPPPKEIEEEVSELPDWVLVGVSKMVDRTEVEIMNKKDRSRVVIPSKTATEMGFRIKEIVQDMSYIDNAYVVLEKGKHKGEVRYDAKFLTLKKVAQTTNSNQGNRANTNQRNSSNRRGNSSNVNRNRPPIPGGRSSSNTRSQSGRGSNTRSNAASGTASGTATNSNNSSSSNPQPRRQRYIPKPNR